MSACGCFCVLACNFVCHVTELNKLIKKLDKRAKESKSGGFKSKVRVLSRPSTLLPPPNPPTWSVTKECLQLNDTTISTPTSVSDVISTVEVQTSSTSTPVSIPRNVVQR